MFAFIYSLYGRAASLCEAKIGQVFNFEYMQPLNGESKRVLARVICFTAFPMGVRSMNASSYRKNDPTFKRTNHFVTCETHDGDVSTVLLRTCQNCRKPLFGTIVA